MIRFLNSRNDTLCKSAKSWRDMEVQRVARQLSCAVLDFGRPIRFAGQSHPAWPITFPFNHHSTIQPDKNGQFRPISMHYLASKIAPLDQVGWLAREAKELREWAAEVGRWRVFEPGQLIYGSGDVSDGVYGLGSGSLEIMFPLVRDEPVFLHLAEVGFWIGDAAELAGNLRFVSLSAASTSRLLHLSSRSIQNLLAAKPHY